MISPDRLKELLAHFKGGKHVSPAIVAQKLRDAPTDVRRSTSSPFAPEIPYFFVEGQWRKVVYVKDPEVESFQQATASAHPTKEVILDTHENGAILCEGKLVVILS